MKPNLSPAMQGAVSGLWIGIITCLLIYFGFYIGHERGLKLGKVIGVKTGISYMKSISYECNHLQRDSLIAWSENDTDSSIKFEDSGILHFLKTDPCDTLSEASNVE